METWNLMLKRIVFLGVWGALLSGCAGGPKPPLPWEEPSDTIAMGTREPGQPERDGAGNFVAGEVLVKFGPEVSDAQRGQIAAAMGLRTVEVVQAPDLFRMRITDGTPVPRMMERLSSQKGVLFAEPNYIRKIE